MNKASIKNYPAAATFGINAPAEATIPGLEDVNDPFVPELDPDYSFLPGPLSDLLAWRQCGLPDGLHIYGQQGCGKSSMVVQTCARLNIPLERPPVNRDMTWGDLIGAMNIIDGDTLFVDGPLTRAMRMGRPILIDEADRIDPAINSGMHAILEGAPLVLPYGGVVVEPQPGFCVITTGNSEGSGDQSGLHPGVMQQDTAFMDRFWTTLMKFMEPDEEVNLLKKKCPDIQNDDIINKMVEYANEVRLLANGVDDDSSHAVDVGRINITMSTRTLVRWGKMMCVFRYKAQQGINPLLYSLERAFTFRAYPEVRMALHELANNIFGDLTKVGGD